jgi:hypothetical protein
MRELTETIGGLILMGLYYGFWLMVIAWLFYFACDQFEKASDGFAREVARKVRNKDKLGS